MHFFEENNKKTCCILFIFKTEYKPYMFKYFTFFDVECHNSQLKLKNKQTNKNSTLTFTPLVQQILLMLDMY